jgi:hypothetical protein
MKSTWRFLLGLFLLAAPAALQAQLTYTINGGAATITGYYGFGPFGVLIIPATLDNFPVSGIADFAFKDLDSVTNVEIPASVTNIGEGAFSGCAILTTITVDTQNSFYSATNGVLFDKNVTTLVEFPSGVAGNYTIPGSVTTIGIGAFEQCYGLTNVTIPGSVANIEGGTFAGCTSLTAIIVDATNLFYSGVNGVLFDKNQTILIEYPGGLAGSYAIPGSIARIEADAFEQCQSLTSVTIPGGVTNIGLGAFLGCSGLATITVNAQDSFYSSTNGVLFDRNQTTLIEYPGGAGGIYKIPGSVTNIGVDAFENCQNLTSVTIPGSVTGIGAGAFENCSFLANATVSIGVTTIESNAFENCFSLSSVTIPGSVTNIGDGAFEYCLSLGSLEIPGSVTSIGEKAFAYCSSLTSVTISSALTSLGDEAFGYCSSLAGIIIPGRVTSIGPYTFYECADLAGVTIPGSVTNIGVGAFEQCYSLAAVTIPGSVTSIGADAFNDCSSLTGITIPAGITAIGNNAFVNCSTLTAITVNAQNLSYSSTNGVLFNKNQTTLIEYPGGVAGSYTIPGGVATIESNAFENCAGLTSVTIPDSVINIGNSAFLGCTSLTAVTIPGSVNNIGDYAFELTNFYFTGNAPAVSSSVFDSYNNPAVYYLPGTTGWTEFSANTGLSAALWNPVIQTRDGGFGVRSGQFGFNITGPTNLVLVVEACTNLTSPVWTPLVTATLANGLFHFSEPMQTSVSGRFYGLGFP